MKNSDNKSPTDYHRLIVSVFCDFNRSNYGVLLNEAVKVYKQYPEPEFWDWLFLNCSNYKVTSPSDFLLKEGTRFLLSRRKLWKTSTLGQKSVEVILEDDTLGEDRSYPNKKPKTLLDFMGDNKQ